MMNMVMLVGRLVKDPEVTESSNGTKLSRITLAINRKFKGNDGVYHTDFIDCTLWNHFAKNVSEYCSKGDLIGVRGRICVEFYEKDGVKRKHFDVVAENVTFLSSSKQREIVELKEEG